jgi:hypothetical protein
MPSYTKRYGQGIQESHSVDIDPEFTATYTCDLPVAWPGCEISAESHGKCLVALAAMHGLAQEELREGELDVEDPRYPVLVTIRCRKAEAPAGR